MLMDRLYQQGCIKWGSLASINEHLNCFQYITNNFIVSIFVCKPWSKLLLLWDVFFICVTCLATSLNPWYWSKYKWVGETIAYYSELYSDIW